MCPPRAETRAARRLLQCFMALSVNQLPISLVPFIRDALLEFVNTGSLYRNVIIKSLHKEY